ncbi:Amiloride-sensitive sodium channel [Trichinella nativa]|uniref:Amiloride-sensitive sodium channel n=1 Tax=Trichinella nativa TaxID=6335 RepID=A0A1Y3ELX9_9BILA|nr:Amiloride-sensitive sodium channel [Trichinella nativa]
MKLMFDAFDNKPLSTPKTSTLLTRKRRASSADEKQYRYTPLYARCSCPNEESDCVPFTSAPLEDGEEICICYFDHVTKSPWPCYSEKQWRSEWCSRCSPNGNCLQILKKRQLSLYEDVKQCVCHSNGKTCLVADKNKPERIWDPAYRDGITDETAKVSRAQENTLFIMAELPPETKKKVSHQKKDFLLQCSFNGRQCDIENDFELLMDPVYGNCYMFNSNSTINRTTSRAGPIYGLSLVIYVDADDYLPTTKASGVRLLVHSQEEYPFPDTNGYNAPTGLLSSFGIRMKKIERLPQPYGDCIKEGKTKDYIYKDQIYSLEGCYRSCFQMEMIKSCGCGDPRFPVPEGRRHCRVKERKARNQYVYDMSFSAAKWPTPSIELDDCNDTAEECIRKLKKNALSLEIYFEQLNYEVLKELQAYQWVNLMADFGGQLGLWMGVSVITIIEVLVLIYEVIKICCTRRKKPTMNKHHRRSIYDDSTVEMTIKIHPPNQNNPKDSIATAHSENDDECSQNSYAMENQYAC